MQDYNQFVANLYGMQAHLGDYMGPQATLFLFSPKLLPTQVLRSYAYNLTPQFYNDVVGRASTLQEAVAPNGAGKAKSVVTAILPEDFGSLLNTYELSNTWSFVLTIDDNPINHGIRMAAPSASTRFIGSGYVAGLDNLGAEEPVNPLTQSINPRAVLVFTHATITYLHNEIGMRGGVRKYTVSHDTDLISALTSMMSASSEQLFLGTPGDLMGMIDTSDPNTMVGAYGPLAITNNMVDEGAKNISSVLKSPKHQLNTVMHALDAALARSDDDFMKSSILPTTPNVQADVVRTTFTQELPNSNYSIPKQGIDTSRPITLMQLQSMFPNINIRPIKVPNQGGWGITPQENMSVRNKMCSMVASTITSILPGCGLADISFRYNSWIKSDQFMATPSGIWEFYEPIHSLAQSTPEQMKKMVELFKMTLENELFPILRAVNGEFDLMAICNLTGEILLDLNYFDDQRNTTSPEDGFYETNGRLGGLMNPMICKLDVLNSNASMLSSLADQAIEKRLGPKAFGDNKYTLEDEPVYTPEANLPPGQAPFQGGHTIPDHQLGQSINANTFSSYSL